MLGKSLKSALIAFIVITGSLEAQIVQPYFIYGSEGIQKSQAWYDAGLLKKSEENLQVILKRFPENAQRDKSVLLLADIDMQNGNYRNADLRLERFISDRTNSPFRPQAALQRGYMAYESKKFDKADKLFASARTMAEYEFSARGDSLYITLAHYSAYWQGMSLAMQGKYQDAQPVFEETFSKYPNGEYSDDALFALGMISEGDRKYDLAINYYKTVAKKYPYSNSFIGARIREINNYLILRDPGSALLAVENAQNAALHITTNDSIGRKYETQSYTGHPLEELTYLRGEAYNLAGNYEQAIVVFRSFVETYKESDILDYVNLSLGWALLNKPDYPEAIRCFDNVITTQGSQESKVKTLAMLYRAVGLKMSGDTAQAQKDLSALSVLPAFPYLDLVLLELGQIYYEKGDYENASRTLERADREATGALTSVRIHLLLGASYMKQNKWTKAVNEYKIAEQLSLKSSPVFMPQKDWYLAESRLKMGISLIKNSRYAEAIQPLLAFIGDNRKDPRAETGMFWLAEAYYRTDMLKNSAETYQSLLDIYPNSSLREESLYGLGWSYFRLKNFDKSSKAFDKMLKEFPDTKHGVEVLTRQGDGYYVTKNFKQAAESYRRAAKLAPRTEEGQYSAYQLAHALYRLGSYEESVTALLSFVRTYPKSSYAPNALYLNGWIRFQQGKYAEAIDDFRFLIQAYPQSNIVVRAQYSIADAYYNMEDYENAITAYRQLVTSYPSSSLAPEAFKSLQYCYMILGRTQEAVQVADELINTNPNSPYVEEFMSKKAELFYQGKNYKDAVQEFENFVNKYPDSEKSSEALMNMAKSYVAMNDPANAHKTFARLREKYPKSNDAIESYLEEGLLYKQENDIGNADKLFGRLQEQYPDLELTAQAGYERAAIKYAMGDTTTAINMFREIADQYKGLEYAVQSRYRMAMHFRMKGLYDSARVEFEKIADNPENPLVVAEARYRIGEIWMLAQNCEEAIKSFSIVKEKFSGMEDWYSLSLLNLGECYEREENYQAAVETYQALSSLRPDDDYGNTARRRLKQLEHK